MLPRRTFVRQFVWCHKAAEGGFAPAAATLGVLYIRISKPELAGRWLKRAADGGDAEARYNLAMLYLQGLGVKQSREEAFLWFGKAAEQGVVAAQSRLGVMYASGMGVASDLIEAHKWFLVASKGGDKSALINCDKSKRQLDVNQVTEAKRRAENWVPRVV